MIILNKGGKLVISCISVVIYTYIELKLIYSQLIYTCDCIYRSRLCHSLCTVQKMRTPPAWTVDPLLFMSTLSVFERNVEMDKSLNIHRNQKHLYFISVLVT